MRDETRIPSPAGGLRAALVVALLGAGSAAWEAAAQAKQEAVARLKSVNGNVLVSRESGLAAGGQAERLSNGTRVITTANSEAVVEFDNGCEVRLKENERFDVDSTRACALLVAQPLGAVGAVGSTFANIVLPIGLGTVLLAGSESVFPSSPIIVTPDVVSPN